MYYSARKTGNSFEERQGKGLYSLLPLTVSVTCKGPIRAPRWSANTVGQRKWPCASLESVSEFWILFFAETDQTSVIREFIASHWEKSQVRRVSDCCSADFGPRLPTNQLYNNPKMDRLETFTSDWLLLNIMGVSVHRVFQLLICKVPHSLCVKISKFGSDRVGEKLHLDCNLCNFLYNCNKVTFQE